MIYLYLAGMLEACVSSWVHDSYQSTYYHLKLLKIENIWIRHLIQTWKQYLNISFRVHISKFLWHVPGTADKGKKVSPPKSSAVKMSLSNTENWIMAFLSWHWWLLAALKNKKKNDDNIFWTLNFENWLSLNSDQCRMK